MRIKEVTKNPWDCHLYKAPASRPMCTYPCIYISQMTIPTTNRGGEQNLPPLPRIVQLTAKVTRVNMKYDAGTKRQLAADVSAHQMKSGGGKTTSLVMNQIFFHLFTAKGSWFNSGRGRALVIVGGRGGWGQRIGAYVYLLSFACPLHYKACIAHFMASILEQIIAGWRRQGEEGGTEGVGGCCSVGL